MPRSPPDLSRVRALVLAGGASQRFFPLDKIFADPTGSGRTMIRQAFDRVTEKVGEGEWREFISPERFLVVTGPAARDRVAEELPVPAGNILVEPERRNTWPAVLWALAHLRREEPRATVAILTADHVIDGVALFRATLARAVEVAEEEGAVVTISIDPAGDPAEWLAYGAVRAGRPEPDEAAAVPEREGAAIEVLPLERFEEKPSVERARGMISAGGWSWNAGMFVFRVDVVEEALRRLQPDMHGIYLRMVEAVAAGDRDQAALHFRSLPGKVPHPVDSERLVDDSIDYAVMMPLTLRRETRIAARVIPARFSWTDIGSWDALRRVVAADRDGNVAVGDVRTEGVRDSILVAERGRFIEARDIRGLVVVHAADGTVLVTREDLAPRIKPLVADVRSNPADPVVFRDSQDVFVEPRGGRAALLGVEGIEVLRAEGGVVVRPIARGGAPGDARGRILDRLARRPLLLRPVLNHYPWGGRTLPGFLGRSIDRSGEPTAEAWLTSTQEDGPATLESSPLELAELVRERPEVLGHWSRRLFGDELPVFVKFLSTRFPPKVHLGFRPGALGKAERDVESFREDLLARLREEQELLRRLRDALDPEELRSDEGFARFRDAYEEWAVGEALAGWSEAERDRELLEALEPLRRREAGRLAETVASLRENRACIDRGFGEVDLRSELGNLLLSPAGTAHAIFGLSHQTHPRDATAPRLAGLMAELRELSRRGATDEELERAARRAAEEFRAARAQDRGAPKNEAWLPVLAGEDVLIVEPQQTSNTTHSWLDLYTPFVRRDGRVVFRKGDPERGLDDPTLARLVETIDLRAADLASLRRIPEEIDPGAGARNARLSRLIDDPGAWPYFTVYRVDLAGDLAEPARWEGDHPEGAFLELVVLEGAVSLSDRDGEVGRLAPGVPAFVPATLEDGFALEATERASVLVVSLPVPRGGSPARADRGG